MNISIKTSPPNFLTAALLADARTLAVHYQHEEDRPGTAATIFNLVSEIEMLRDAAKGSLIIVRQACSAADLANLRASVLLLIAEKLAPVIDQEIEQRQHGGNVEDWAALQALSNELHGAIRLAKG